MRRNSLIISFIVLGFDQLIKIIIDNSFYYGKLATVIPKFFYITKVYNDGAAWSTFRGDTILLIGIAILSFAILMYYQMKFVKNRRNTITFGIIYGGLFGNLIDRLAYGHVIDYFKMNFGNYNFPIFNLADVMIVVGFGLLIYAIYKGDDKHGNSSN